jgi:hypothetical protein
LAGHGFAACGKIRSVSGHGFTGCGKTHSRDWFWVAQRFTAAITASFSMPALAAEVTLAESLSSIEYVFRTFVEELSNNKSKERKKNFRTHAIKQQSRTTNDQRPTTNDQRPTTNDEI